MCIRDRRKDQLKIYGDAPATVSVSIVTVAPEALGDAGKFALTNGRAYVNTLSFVISTSVTIVEIL